MYLSELLTRGQYYACYEIFFVPLTFMYIRIRKALTGWTE